MNQGMHVDVGYANDQDIPLQSHRHPQHSIYKESSAQLSPNNVDVPFKIRLECNAHIQRDHQDSQENGLRLLCMTITRVPKMTRVWDQKNSCQGMLRANK